MEKNSIVLTTENLSVSRLIHNLDKVELSLLNNKLKDIGLSNIQALVIIYLSDNINQEVFQKNLEKEFGVTNPTMTVSLKSMQAKGLIVKEKSKVDGRYYRLVLTTKGKNLYPKCISIYTEIDALHRTILSKEEIEFLSQILPKLTATLKERID